MRKDAEGAEKFEARSRAFTVLHYVLLLGYAAVVIFSRGDRLVSSNGFLVLGTGLSVVGALLLLAAVFTLRRVVQVQPEPRQGGHLITKGIYGRFRHPIYTAIALVAIGIFFRTPTLPNAIAAVLLITFFAIKARFEERLLALRYPDYAGYKRRTWGVIPGIF